MKLEFLFLFTSQETRKIIGKYIVDLLKMSTDRIYRNSDIVSNYLISWKNTPGKLTINENNCTLLSSLTRLFGLIQFSLTQPVSTLFYI